MRSGPYTLTDRPWPSRRDQPGRHALDVLERFLERDDIGVLRLDVEQVRLVRSLRTVADAVARDERRPAVLQQVDRRRADASRSWSPRRGSPCRRPGSRRIVARFVPKKPDAPFFSTTGSSSRGSSRGSISTQGPSSWSSAERRGLLHPETAVLAGAARGRWSCRRPEGPSPAPRRVAAAWPRPRR